MVLALRWGRPSSSGRSRGFTGERHSFPLVTCAALLLKNQALASHCCWSRAVLRNRLHHGVYSDSGGLTGWGQRQVGRKRQVRASQRGSGLPTQKGKQGHTHHQGSLSGGSFPHVSPLEWYPAVKGHVKQPMSWGFRVLLLPPVGGAHGHPVLYSSIPLWLDFWAAFRVLTVTNAAAMDSLPLSPRDMGLGVEQLCCVACIVQFAEMAFHENFNLHFLEFF